MFRRLGAVVLAWLTVYPLAFAAPIPGGQVAPEALLDGRCGLYLRYDGYAPHRQALEKTALAEVWRNGFQEAYHRLLEQFWGLLDTIPLPESADQLKHHLPMALSRLLEDGFVVGVQLFDPTEFRMQITVVLPRQAAGEKHFAALLRFWAEVNDWKVTAVRVRDRQIQQIQIEDTSWHIFWWTEAEHLVLLIGTESPQETLDVREGKIPSVLQNEWYKRLANGPGYETFLRGYINGKPWLEAMRQLGPEAQKFIGVLGLEDIPAITWYMGTEGRAIRSTVCVHLVRAPRRGLAALFPDMQKGIESYWQNLTMLPPLAPRAEVALFQFDVAEFGKQLRHVAEFAGQILIGAEGAAEIREQLDDLAQSPAGKLLAELVPHLDSVWFISDASADGILSTGTMVGVRLKNSAAVRKLLAKLQPFDVWDVRVEFRTRQYRGFELICMSLGERLGPFGLFPVVPTLAVVDDWLLFSLWPQPIQGVILRRESKQWARWKPSAEAQQFLAQLANKPGGRLVGFEESDPRGTMEFLGSIIPFIGGLIHSATGGEFDVTLLPHTQALSEPLFPNVTLYLAEPDCLRIESRDSLSVPGTFWWFPALEGLFEFVFQMF